MLLYIMLYIVLAYLMLFAALTNSVCLNNAVEQQVILSEENGDFQGLNGCNEYVL